ncbi:importin N-terminal domain-containing protein [Haematococcus lacustris]|uniref:Importin N-terminal domain-containing protein n=1 Tax=Haematococcus lacustris TaxID=44745 RepID=A0A699Y8P0_HAELA|nr:importin N-terminal domain-containing protein [Haematococcus lacustris]
MHFQQKWAASGAAGGLEALLMREAAYRCIGEGYAHVGPHVSFSAWYGNELAPLLSTRAAAAAQGTLAVTDSVLQ